MSSNRPKQDRQGVRTATDIERKYNLGNAVTASYVQATVRSAVATATNDFKGYVEEFNKDVVEQGKDIATLKEADIDIQEGLSALQQADLEIEESIQKVQVTVSATERSVAENRTSISQANASIVGIEQSIDGIELAMATTNAATDKSISDLRNDLESTTSTANRAAENVDGVINDINDRMAFVEGGTTFKGSIVPLALPQGTDLDGVLHLNKYVGGDVAENEYLNCPIQSGTFSLEVESVGNEGQLLQRLTYSHKTEGKTFERVFDLDEWGHWILVSDYAWTSVETVEDDAETLEAAFNKFKTDSAARMTEAENDIATIGNNVDALEKSADDLRTDVLAVSTDLQGVINDMIDHFSFVEGGTTFKGGIIPMVLPQGTDLDGVTNPNKYTSGNVAEYQYLNCPITSGTFFLEVEMCGSEGQLLQRLTYSHKTNGKTYERGFYSDGWGAWVLVTDYTGAALKAIQSDVDALKKTVTDHKTADSSWKQKTEGDISSLGDDLEALSDSTQTLSGNVQSMSSDLQGVINDVNDHFEFNEGGMTIKGGINPLLLPAGTDLDGIMIPNKYVGGTVTEYNYVNCPVASGTFLLDVELCGEKGQVKQSLSYCNKTLGRTYERYFYGSAWGEWVRITDFVPEETGKLLWNEGVYYMTATQTVNLPEAVSAQKNGIVLVFSEYANGAASDTAIHCFFVPKIQVANQPGKSYVFTLATSKFAYMATKQVFIYDTKIEGHADNNQTGAGTSGITFTNNRFVLRYVFGV